MQVKEAETEKSKAIRESKNPFTDDSSLLSTQTVSKKETLLTLGEEKKESCPEKTESKTTSKRKAEPTSPSDSSLTQKKQKIETEIEAFSLDNDDDIFVKDSYRMLPAFCIIKQHEGNIECDLIWVHKRARRMGIAAEFVRVLKIEYVGTALSKSLEFWNKMKITPKTVSKADVKEEYVP